MSYEPPYTPKLADVERAWEAWRMQDEVMPRHAHAELNRFVDAIMAEVFASPPPGWSVFGSHVDDPGPLEFWGEHLSNDGLPVWERRG